MEDKFVHPRVAVAEVLTEAFPDLNWAEAPHDQTMVYAKGSRPSVWVTYSARQGVFLYTVNVGCGHMFESAPLTIGHVARVVKLAVECIEQCQ